MTDNKFDRIKVFLYHFFTMRKIFTAGLFALLPFFLFLQPVYSKDQSQLAKCLSERGFQMYGSKVCPACDLQREYFGDSFSLVTYTDCLENASICKSKNINSYPTWEDKEGKTYKGAISPEILAQLSGCASSSQIKLVPTTIKSQDKAEKVEPFLKLDEVIASFIAGFVSFFAPCLLPLFPTFLSVITGFTFADLYGLNFSRIKSRVLLSSAFFIFGFSLIFLFILSLEVLTAVINLSQRM